MQLLACELSLSNSLSKMQMSRPVVCHALFVAVVLAAAATATDRQPAEVAAASKAVLHCCQAQMGHSQPTTTNLLLVYFDAGRHEAI